MSLQEVELAMFDARAHPGNIDKYLSALASVDLTVVTAQKEIYLRCPMDRPIPADLLCLEQGESEGLPDGTFVDVYTFNFDALYSTCGLTMKHFKSRIDTSNKDILVDFTQKLSYAMLNSIVQDHQVELEYLDDIDSLHIFIDKLLSLYDLTVIAGIAGFNPKSIRTDDPSIVEDISELVKFRRTYMATLVTCAGVVEVPKMKLLEHFFPGQLPTFSSDIFFYFLMFNCHRYRDRQLANRAAREFIHTRLSRWILPAFEYVYVDVCGLIFIPKTERFMKATEHAQMLEDMVLVEEHWKIKDTVFMEMYERGVNFDERGIFYELELARDRLQREGVLDSFASFKATSEGRFVEGLFSVAKLPLHGLVEVVDMRTQTSCFTSKRVSDDLSITLEPPSMSLTDVLNISGLMTDEVFPVVEEEESLDVLNTALIVEEEGDVFVAGCGHLGSLFTVFEGEEDSTADVSEDGEILAIVEYRGPLYDCKGFPYCIIFEDDLSEIMHVDQDALDAQEIAEAEQRLADLILALTDTEEEVSLVSLREEVSQIGLDEEDVLLTIEVQVSEEDEVVASWWDKVVDAVGGLFCCCTQRL